MKQQMKAYLFALSAVLLWSTVATAFKLSLQQLNYSQLLLISSGISLFVLLAIILIKTYFSNSDFYNSFEVSSEPNLYKELSYFRKLKKTAINGNFDFQGIIFSLTLGFLNPFLYYLILFKAYSLLPAQEAISLNYTWGIIVVLFSIIFLKQKVHLINIIFLLLSFIGVVIIATGGNLTDLQFKNTEGVFYALSSAIVWGLFWVLNMKDKRDDLIKLFLNFFFGFVFILIYTAFFSSFKINITYSFFSAVYVGIFEMGITFVFWLKALQLSKTTALVSNLVFLSPFLSLFFVSVIIKEEIQFSTILGLIFIVTGILLQNIVRKKIETN